MPEILQTDFTKEMEQCYLNYSMSVITNRALPDVRDGLKPVHRRILYAMYNDLKLTYDKHHKKSARIVGEVIGRWHPHGDSSVYEALVRLAQNFSMRYPLIDGQGNMGSIDGDSAAAMRYTEAKLSKMAQYMFTNDMKDIVDFKPNFSEDDYEPTILPALLPNLLVNPTTGIAVGMACSFAPHNLNEVINAIIAYINNKKITIDELLQHIEGPDFPTGGEIINKDEMLSAYKTGRGTVKIRARYKIEEGKRGVKSLVFYEIPYNTTTSKILEQINKLFENNKEIGAAIKTLRDESADGELRLVIEFTPSKIDIETLIQALYANTDLQTNFSINNTCLVDGTPKTLNLKQIIQHYYDFQIDLIIKSSEVELEKIAKRLHILDGYLIALNHIDNVIQIIKSSTNTSEAAIKLQNEYNLSEIQTKAILDLKLSKLTSLGYDEIKQEQVELLARQDTLNRILGNDNEKDKVLINKLLQLKEEFGDHRRTEIKNVIIENSSKTKKTKSEPKEENVIVTIDNKYNLKLNSNIKDYKYKFITTTLSNLIIFTNKNKVYKLNLIEGKIPTLLKFDSDEKILLILDSKTTKENTELLFATKLGKVKRVAAEEFINMKRSSMIASSLDEDNEIVNISIIEPNDKYIIIINTDGCGIKTDINNINKYGKNAAGVQGMKLSNNTVINAFACKDKDNIVFVSRNGEIHKIPINQLSVQNRGGKGVKIYKSQQELVKAIKANNNNSILISGNETKIIGVNDIPEYPIQIIKSIVLNVELA